MNPIETLLLSSSRRQKSNRSTKTNPLPFRLSVRFYWERRGKRPVAAPATMMTCIVGDDENDDKIGVLRSSRSAFLFGTAATVRRSYPLVAVW
ncbi:unnamed protein product [Linum tenue]|uniref:Uncharacterized protein n=1 Tax=Linum tenue TaxID=586396 RepID=A0AAV0MF96_9ROSI|nr:unnamed protein product [Linum tenue]